VGKLCTTCKRIASIMQIDAKTVADMPGTRAIYRGAMESTYRKNGQNVGTITYYYGQVRYCWTCGANIVRPRVNRKMEE
jgi:hypothetical protein